MPASHGTALFLANGGLRSTQQRARQRWGHLLRVVSTRELSGENRLSCFTTVCTPPMIQKQVLAEQGDGSAVSGSSGRLTDALQAESSSMVLPMPCALPRSGKWLGAKCAQRGGVEFRGVDAVLACPIGLRAVGVLNRRQGGCGSVSVVTGAVVSAQGRPCCRANVRRDRRRVWRPTGTGGPAGPIGGPRHHRR